MSLKEWPDGKTDFRDGFENVPSAVARSYPANNVEEGHERIRQETLARMREDITAALAYVFADDFPHFHEMHLLHPNPVESAELARAAFRARRIGWRGAQWLATVEALELTKAGDPNTFGRLWLRAVHYWRPLQYKQYWDIDTPHRVPSYVPIGTPSQEAHEQWQPETSLWDIEDAAAHELELGAGGWATYQLRDLWPSTDATRKAVDAVRARVHRYLKHWKAATALPDNPYDPNHWGHDARLQELRIREFNEGREIRLRPRFHPDVLFYGTSQVLLDHEDNGTTFFDPLMTLAANVSKRLTNTHQERDTLEVTVTAADGTTTRVYKIVTT